MISDITLGQFFPGYSVIHKLDPRTKIVLAVLFSCSYNTLSDIYEQDLGKGHFQINKAARLYPCVYRYS